MLATFLASFGFFGAIIFLPRWFQFVSGVSPTSSGYQILPLLVGLIVSSIVAGIIVRRTGRYKALIIAGARRSCPSAIAADDQLTADTR